MFETYSYPKEDMENHGLHSDWATSIMIPYGYQVQLFDYSGLDGPSYIIQGPPYLDETKQHACVNLDDFDDRTASLSVTKTG